MKLEQQVSSVELSNKLHKLGVTTPSQYFRDWAGAKENEIESWGQEDGDCCPDNVNCYTAAELGEILREHDIDGMVILNDWASNGFRIWLSNMEDDQFPWDFNGESTFIESTEADARAKMLIYLIENKLIQVGNLSAIEVP